MKRNEGVRTRGSMAISPQISNRIDCLEIKVQLFEVDFFANLSEIEENTDVLRKTLYWWKKNMFCFV